MHIIYIYIYTCSGTLNRVFYVNDLARATDPFLGPCYFLFAQRPDIACILLLAYTGKLPFARALLQFQPRPARAPVLKGRAAVAGDDSPAAKRAWASVRARGIATAV